MGWLLGESAKTSLDEAYFVTIYLLFVHSNVDFFY